MNILGIDPSLTATGLYLRETGLMAAPESTLIAPKNLRDTERLCFIRDFLLGFINRDRAFSPELAVIEGYAMGAKTHTHDLGEAGAMLKTAVYEAGIDLLIVPPATLKKFITGSGNSKKQVMMVEALSRYHVKITDDNICDAFCLTHFGEAWYAANAFGRTAGKIGITKSQYACLSAARLVPGRKRSSRR